MTDPKRLREMDGTHADLLRAAKWDDAPADAEDRVLAALAATTVLSAAALGATATKSAAPSALAAGTKLGALFGAKGIILALAVGAVAAPVAYVALRAGSPSSPVSQVSAPAAKPVSSSRPSEDERVYPASTAEAAPTIVPTAVEPPHSGQEPPALRKELLAQPKAASKVARPAATLASEVELIDRARSALASGDGQAASEALSEHRNRFPAGALTEEADLARVELLVSRGETRRARVAAEAFLQRHPGSAYERRVRTILKQVSNP